MSTRVKICGITNTEDANASIISGADAIGFVFVEQSPRFLSIEKAIEIVESLASVISIVGLFVNSSQKHIKHVIENVPIDYLQFHGDESETECSLYNIPYIKSVPMKDNVDLLDYIDSYTSAEAFLLDSHTSGKLGGTGNVFDWDNIPKAIDVPIILAGGLTSSNVKTAVEKIRPYGVDVSSGVEYEKGIKDPQKIYEFIKEVKKADYVK
ncbi:MAG: phosphoribosylanthranilate isomerase [Pseudomonadota bacterium]